MDKHEIGKVMNEIGILLEIKGESFFKSKAYYDAARAIEFIEEDIETLVAENRLKEIKGFGEALSRKIGELVTTGRLEYYEKLKAEVPGGLLSMLKIPGLGPKKVKALYLKLNITSIGELRQACLDNRLLGLEGFGGKTQKKILDGIENMGNYQGQFLYAHASRLAEELLKVLSDNPKVIRCSIGGSLRRKKETVKDMDILVSSNDSAAVMDLFTSHPLVKDIISKGDTKSSVTLHDGINADLRVVSDTEYPYALHHFTGSKEHNTAMRHIAKQQGIKMNEYGLFRDEGLVRCSDEGEIFGCFQMAFIPPELRENNGEIEAAMEGRLPELIDYTDVRGIIHVHSNYSDGANTIEELANYCMHGGYTYMGISDHSQTAYYAGGLKVEDIKRQHEEIDRLNAGFRDFKIYKGIELDILPDGSVDYDEEVLSWFDFTIASVHSSFGMEEDKMTDRVIRAMKNKYVTILGHPTGRLLLSREPFRINMNEIIKTAAEENVILEINANPHRLDLDWRLCKPAREAGCRFAVCPDAHRVEGIEDVLYGVNIARKGWLEAGDVINTLDTGEFYKVLKKRSNGQ